ncbi:sensor histidine kinase [Kitasatospora sp. NPDC048286]|uniref:sensor histidine kinase n=1 Tax=Kitasatospora sp. NPDC048286 TaxID=3364047 RepID=UPI003710B62F
MRRRPAPTPAARRAHRLRCRLTALFTLTSAVGLIGLAAFAVHNDDVSRRRQIDTELTLQLSQAMPGISIDDQGRLDTSLLNDYVETACPALHVLTGSAADLKPVFTPRQPCAHVRPVDLRAVATAAQQETDAMADAEGTDGHPLRLAAAVFAGPEDQSTDGSGQTAGGAIVAARDLTTDQAAHRELAVLLTGGCAALIALSAVAGHLLAGRAIRPALTALEQQEAFLADAAHDLRTPAASLRMLAETALLDEASRTTALERTVRLATRMGGMIDDLLTQARLSAGVERLASEPLRLDQLVEAVVDELRTGEHRITLRTEPTVVTADPDLLRRAVANLVGNALTHGHTAGRPAEVEVTVTADGTLTVDDAGPGIPAELAGSLFDRFRSGSGSSGLGLSIASRVARAHRGTLTAGPGPLGGARFTLRLAARAG